MSNVRKRFFLRFALAGFVAFVATAAPRPAEATADDDANLRATLRRANAGLRRFVLDNGLVGLVKADAAAPVVAVQVWVGTGSVHEDEYLGGGLAHYLEHMIFKGTTNRGPTDVTTDISDAGGRVNAYTTFDRTVYAADLPSKNWRVGLDVLSDGVMNATLPADEWEREKKVILREFAMGRDDPRRVMNKLLYATAFRVHPYRVPVIGYEEVFEQMNRDTLTAFYRRHYVPDNMIVVIVGDVDPDEVEAAARASFANFVRRPRAPVVLPAEPPQASPRIGRSTGAYEVERIQWAYHTTALSHPDTPALDVLAAVVGHGRSSRLSQDLKETQRLVHDIGAYSYTPKDPGVFTVHASFSPTNEAAVLAAIRRQVESWPTADFSEAEIAKARRRVLSSELSSMQTMKGQARNYASGEFYAGNPLYSEVYVDQVLAVNADQLREVASRYMVDANRVTAILAPEATTTNDGPATSAEPASPVERSSLPNGATILHRRDQRLPFVYFCAALRGGLLSETEENNGIGQLMANLLTRGTPGRAAAEIDDLVESLGGSLRAFSGRNSFGLRAHCLTGDREVFAELFADCLLRPTFPAEEFDKQKTLQLAGIRRQRERPFFHADKALGEAIFPNHPYRWQPHGSEASVGGLSRDDIAAHWRSAVGAENLVLAIFGDISRDEAIALATKHFGDLASGGRPPEPPTADTTQLPSRHSLRIPKRQAILLMGYPGVSVDSPDAAVLDILDTALSGLSSDLGIAVREQRGLVYYIGASHRPGVAPGLFNIYAGTREDAVEEVEQLVNAELARIADPGIRPEELARAREQLLAAHDMSLQENADVALSCALNELYGLGFDYAFSLPERLNAITIDRIREVATKLLDRSRQAVSVVLPAEP